MLQASEPRSPESVTTKETSFRELAQWAIGILRRHLLVIALIGGAHQRALTKNRRSLNVWWVISKKQRHDYRIVIDPRRVQLFLKATFSEGPITSNRDGRRRRRGSCGHAGQ